MEKFLKNNAIFLLPVLSGVFFIFAYPPNGFPGFVWLALVPLLFFIYNKKTSAKQAFWGGFLAGLIFLGSVISWFFSAYPADWMNAGKSPLIFSLLILVWLVNAACLAVFVGLFSFILKKLKRDNWFDILLIPGLWIVFEYLRAWSLGILWLGRDSLAGPHWTFGFLGYSLADSPNFLQWAGLGGAYGLGFLVVFINGLIFYVLRGFVQKGGKFNFSFFKNLAVLVLIFSFLNAGGALMKSAKEKTEPSRTLETAIIQTKFPSHFEYNSEIINSELNIRLGLLGQAVGVPPFPDLVVFPEDSRFLDSLVRHRPAFDLKNFLKNRPAAVVDSGRVIDPAGGNYFRIYYFNPEEGRIEGQKKSFLLPGGEYFPYLSRFILALAGKNSWLERFEANREYVKGMEPALGEHRGVKIGTLFCTEIFSPGLFRQISDFGAEILVNVASHGVFRGSSSLLAQAQAAAKLRAVENNRWLVQAANYNLSSIIDNRGNIAATSRRIGNEVLKGVAYPVSEKTFYTKCGDWILLLAAFIGCFAFLKKKS